MKIKYINPVINISYFNTENIVTNSGMTAENALSNKGTQNIQEMNIANTSKINVTW